MKADAETTRLAVLNLAEFICESDAIENIQDDPDLVIRQIEQRKQDGYVGAMLLLESLVQSSLNTESYITKELICKIQGLITAEQHKKRGGKKLEPEYIGCYRPRGIEMRVGEKSCLESAMVPVAMNKLLDRAKWWQENSRFYPWDYNLNYIADFHFYFLTTHPFADGNGRTSRALAYYMMRWAALKPFIFTSADKHENYYSCFDDSESHLMRTYFLQKFSKNI